MPANMGDLSRALTHDPNEDWPTYLEIVAYWSRDGSRRGLRRSVRIDADQFFGVGQFGAPMSGEQLIGIVNQLRQQGAYRGVKEKAQKKTPNISRHDGAVVLRRAHQRNASAGSK